MSFKELADNLNELFRRKLMRTSELLNCSCMSSNTQEWRQDIEERVWSVYSDDERKMSSARTSRVEIKIITNEELFCKLKTPEQPKKLGKSVNDFSFITEKPLLPTRNNKLAEQGGGPRRPGLLRAEPIRLLRPPTSIKIKKLQQVRPNWNLRPREFVFASSNNESSEYYDDRAPVFGGWMSDSSDINSCAKLGLSILGSIESDRDYGGEEGAKPFVAANNDGSVSNALSHSEGQGEDKSRRPSWSSDDDDLLEAVFFSGQLSPYHDSDHVKDSLLEENENSLQLIDAKRNYAEFSVEIP